MPPVGQGFQTTTVAAGSAWRRRAYCGGVAAAKGRHRRAAEQDRPERRPECTDRTQVQEVRAATTVRGVPSWDRERLADFKEYARAASDKARTVPGKRPGRRDQALPVIFGILHQAGPLLDDSREVNAVHRTDLLAHCGSPVADDRHR